MLKRWIDYLEGVRHPSMALLFVVPLLMMYEGGRWAGGPAGVEEVRNGAEHWLRQGVEWLGFSGNWACPGLLLGVLLAWTVFRRHDRPSKLWRLGTGMLVESVLFAVGFYLLSLGFLPVFNGLGITLTAEIKRQTSGLDPELARMLRYLGAGIYEEALFRLGLFTLFCWLFRFADFSRLFSLNLAAVASALAFSGAHHLEQTAEPFHAAVFLYRGIAGYYFAWVYRLRGLGIAIGAHACYNILLGFLLPSG